MLFELVIGAGILYVCRMYLYPWHVHIDGTLPKWPYPPCVRIADRALFAGYHRFRFLICCVWFVCVSSYGLIWLIYPSLSEFLYWLWSNHVLVSLLVMNSWRIYVNLTSTEQQDIQQNCIFSGVNCLQNTMRSILTSIMPIVFLALVVMTLILFNCGRNNICIIYIYIYRHYHSLITLTTSSTFEVRPIPMNSIYK